MATTIQAGFYATEEHTAYVTPLGKVYCVQTVDLVELPRKWDSLPDGFTPVDQMIPGDDQAEFLAQIREEYGQDATD